MSRVAIVARDLIITTRIADAAAASGHQVIRVDTPAELPPAASVDLAFVDWGSRQPGWAEAITGWCTGAPLTRRPGLVLFGPHSDLTAHADARAAGLGPMLARSKLVADLPGLLARTG